MRRWSEKAVLASVPEEDREFVIGIWPPEFERILNGESGCYVDATSSSRQNGM